MPKHAAPDLRPLAPCRIFNATSGRLVAGVGQPIPDGLPLRYEDPSLTPAGAGAQTTAGGPVEDVAASALAEPEPETAKRGSRKRTRRRPPVENRTAEPETEAGTEPRPEADEDGGG